MPNYDDEPLFRDFREAEIPRWMQIPIGIILGLLTLFCALATSVLLFPGKYAPSPILARAVGVILLLGCLWLLGKCFRLVTGRKRKGGLLSPTVLRVVAIFLLIIPMAGLFTGYYREMRGLAVFQAVMYVFGFFGLRALATKREIVHDEQAKSEDGDAPFDPPKNPMLP